MDGIIEEIKAISLQRMMRKTVQEMFFITLLICIVPIKVLKMIHITTQ